MHKLAKVVHFLTHTIRLESDRKETCIIRCMWNVKQGIFAIKIGLFGDCVGGCGCGCACYCGCWLLAFSIPRHSPPGGCATICIMLLMVVVVFVVVAFGCVGVFVVAVHVVVGC